MILQALWQLAQQENLRPIPDYEPRRVSWRVVLNKDGTLINFADYRIDVNADLKKKPHYIGQWSLVPIQPIRTSGARSFFLVDKSEYALGLDPLGKRDAKKLRERFDLFEAEAAACADAIQDKGILAVLKFLKSVRDSPELISNHSNFEHVQPNDLIGFAVQSDWVHESKAVVEYYSAHRQLDLKVEQDDCHRYQCLITGKTIESVPLFPLLKKVPGGTSSGVALVSHNAKAYCSYDLVGNENAPVSREAAEACGIALTRLLDADYPNPNSLQETLSSRRIKLGSNTALCFWTRDVDDAATDMLDNLPDILLGESEDSVKANFQSIWSGRPAPLTTSNNFYGLTLSGTQGRAIVRDWFETSMQDLNIQLAQHFADLKICRNTRPKKGSKASPAVPLSWLLKSLAAEGRSEPVPPTVESSFVRAALKGSEYPFQLLQRALVRSRAEAGGDQWGDSMRRDARSSLLRAILNRRRRKNPEYQELYPEVNIDMNPTLKSPGYTCGMLMAVIERLQSLALGDVNASVIDRFFGAASASPRSVFVRLLKNSQHHYRKVRDDSDKLKRASGRYMERLKDEIISRFQLVGSKQGKSIYPTSLGLPMHLNLEQQGLFVLGYHQMRHWLWMTKDERKSWEAKYPDAPAVFKKKKQDSTKSK